MSGIGEFPELIKNAFVTKTYDPTGIIGIRFFIRGKPWILTIDDEFLFQFPQANKPHLVYA